MILEVMLLMLAGGTLGLVLVHLIVAPFVKRADRRKPRRPSPTAAYNFALRRPLRDAPFYDSYQLGYTRGLSDAAEINQSKTSANSLGVSLRAIIGSRRST